MGLDADDPADCGTAYPGEYFEPRVFFKALGLLDGSDTPKFVRQQDRFAACLPNCSLGQKLVTIALKRCQVDLGCFHGPEAAASCLVSKVGGLVGGADKYRLPRAGIDKS